MAIKYQICTAPARYINIKTFSHVILLAALVRALSRRPSNYGLPPTYHFNHLEDDYISRDRLITSILIFIFYLHKNLVCFLPVDQGISTYHVCLYLYKILFLEFLYEKFSIYVHNFIILTSVV